MKTGILILAGALLCVPAVASAQAAAETAAVSNVVTGEVIRFEPGRLLLVRSSDGREVTFALTPALVVPAEVQVGRTVSVYSDQGTSGAATVTRVTTTSVTPEGQTKTTTEETRRDPSGATTKTTTTTVQGKVETYLPGKSITLIKDDGSSVTFTVPEGTRVPQDITVGKTVTIRMRPNGTVVETIVVDKQE